MKRRDTDPQLRRLIETAGVGGSVSVVCSLTRNPRRPVNPEETQQNVDALLRRVEDQTGERPVESSVFSNIGAFALSAPVPFIERLIAQPEIATATANVQQEDLLIRPIERRRAGGPRRGGS
jgi:hypothetical protein